jgi:predicted DNA-binding protein with PD1-like motif
MKAKIIQDQSPQVIVAIFETGDEAVDGLTSLAKELRLEASQLSGVGAFSDAVLGFFDWKTKQYKRIPVDGQVEVLSLAGDITLDGDEPKVHVHVVLGRSDGSTLGGHLMQAHVRPTLEVIISESAAHLRRVHDPESGLDLIAL